MGVTYNFNCCWTLSHHTQLIVGVLYPTILNCCWTLSHRDHTQLLLNFIEPYSIEDFYKDCPGTRYGASPERNNCDVCDSRLICHLFFDFGKPTIDHCCVPRFSNGRRTSPSLSYHSFPLSSGLRKHWVVALRRDEGANSRVSESTVLQHAVSASSEKISLSFSCPRVCGLSHYRSWQSKESWSLPESRCRAIGIFFFFCPQLEVSVTCAGL